METWRKWKATLRFYLESMSHSLASGDEDSIDYEYEYLKIREDTFKEIERDLKGRVNATVKEGLPGEYRKSGFQSYTGKDKYSG